MIRLQKINNEKVTPVKIPCIEKDKIRGVCLFEELYCDVFICSKKKTGKTSIIWKILKKCVGRDTQIVIIAPTVNKDPSYIHIQKYFKKKGNDVLTYTSIKEGKIDNLADILKKLEQPDEPVSSDEDEEEKPKFLINFNSDDDDEEKEKKKRKEKYISPEVIFVLDDLSTQLRSPSVADLVKRNRHYKSKVLISTQYPNDLLPESIKMMDYVILGPKQTADKLEKIHTDLDLSTEYDKYLEMYYEATDEIYNFLYIDVTNEQFRRNFNYEFF